MNPDWSDEELERWVEQAREKVVGSMRCRMLRDAHTERSYAPIETPPGAAGDEKMVETAWTRSLKRRQFIYTKWRTVYKTTEKM